MKKNNDLLTILINESYNYLFKIKNKIIIDKSENNKLTLSENESLKHSTALNTVWLLNLKKLHNLVKQKIDLKNYHFIDIGCGNGIPLIYAYKKLKFKSYSGIDLISDYINITKKNIKSSLGSTSIKIIHADAANFVLENKSYFLFMYNPFDEVIMTKFITNNYEILIKNNSVIAYSNYNQLNIIKKFTNNIEEIKKLKLACCYF